MKLYGHGRALRDNSQLNVTLLGATHNVQSFLAALVTDVFHLTLAPTGAGGITAPPPGDLQNEAS